MPVLIDLTGRTFGRLIGGRTQSCGCLARERRTTHGMTGTRSYRSFVERRYRERKANFDKGWTLEMEIALRELQPACVVCGSTVRLATDHVRPLSRGYGLKPGNAVTLCGSCNSKKHAKPISRLPLKTRTAITKSASDFQVHWSRLETSRN